MEAYTFNSNAQDRQRQGDQDHKLEISLDYIVSSRLSYSSPERERERAPNLCIPGSPGSTSLPLPPLPQLLRRALTSFMNGTRLQASSCWTSLSNTPWDLG